MCGLLKRVNEIFIDDSYVIKSHFLVYMTFSFSILGTKNVERNFYKD
jgi:hypothetical protein